VLTFKGLPNSSLNVNPSTSVLTNAVFANEGASTLIPAVILSFLENENSS